MNIEIRIQQIAASEYVAKYRDIHKFIKFCKECNCYNKTWSCPPFETKTGSYIDYKNQKIEDFEILTIIGVKINIEEKLRTSSRNLKERDDLTRDIITKVRREFDAKLLRLEQQITPSMAYFAGSCVICPKDECSRIKHQPCRYPEKMRSTLEADGFDIGRTCTELLEVEIKWCDKLALPEYYTLCYGFLSHQDATDQLKGILK